MTAQSGNLALVRDALTAQIGEVVGYGDIDPLMMEMDAAVTPAWHIVETIPGHERVAAAHLAGRRFLIFIPDMRYEPKPRRKKDDAIERGKKLPALQRMFVGYIFVFAWMNDKNWKRIKSVPGVQRVVCQPLSEKLVTLSDAQIGVLRSLEALLCPIELPPGWGNGGRKRHGWRRARRETVEDQTPVAAVKGWVNVGDQWIDTIDVLRVLDGRDENQAIAKALGLAS